jgi:hypothetical protein
MRLDLPLVPPRQRPANANHDTIQQRTPLTNTSPYQSGVWVSPEFRIVALSTPVRLVCS